jgi:16S rRNA (cytidine1402-2'-O)-methyltransferase
MPTLYIVATPIGNLEDVTLRALRILREVKLIAAEDTRTTRKLLARYKIETPLTSYHEHTRQNKMNYILERLKEDDVALVSEAGMPGVSDPGYELIRAAYERGIAVVPVPGPSAIITALAVSGLPTEHFTYIGFLPNRANARRQMLESIAHEKATVIAFEAPHRLSASLNDILSILGDRKIAVCRELTKLHEEIFRGTVSEAIKYFVQPRGEFTLVIAGRQEKMKPELTKEIEKRLHYMYLSGMPAKKATAKLAEETGLTRRELYRAWLTLDKVWSRKKESYQSSGGVK